MAQNDPTSAWDAVFTAAAKRFRSRPKPGAHPKGPGADRKQLEKWALQAADDLRALTCTEQVAPSAPTPIVEMASVLGHQVVYRRQTFDGHLSPANGGEIRVRSDASPARTRFTIAHELGHLWLAEHAPPAHPGRGLSPVTVERLCDAVAGHLLLPAQHLSALPPIPNLNAVRDLAESASVSPQVVVNQATRRGRWRCLLLDWKLRSRWSVEACAGGPWDASGWTMMPNAVSTPIRAQRCVLDVETQTGSQLMHAQIGSWSRTRLTTLLVPTTGGYRQASS